MTPQTLPVVSGDKDRSLQEALGRLSASKAPGGRDADPIVTATRRLPAVAASYAPFPERIDERLRRALAARGIEQLYTHQAEAFDHALSGRNVVTITPTASGKTLCYNAPVLDAILKDHSTRALYLFPTKALAQDQLAELHGLVELIAQQSACGQREVPSAFARSASAGQPSAGDDSGRGHGEVAPEIGVFTYDGDTPSDARRAIRARRISC